MKVLVQDTDGLNQFIQLKRYPGTSDFFNKIMKDLQNINLVKTVESHSGTLMFFPIKPVVDFAVKKLKDNPNYLITA